MKTKAVFQTDRDGLFAYETVANELPLAPGYYNVPYGAREDAPPEAPAGMVARGVDGQPWALVEDYRAANLWVRATGEPYTCRDLIEIDGESASYPGWGPLPSWLTVEEPEKAAAEA